MSEKTHTLVCLVEDQPGVLNRVMSLFRRRMFNADSVAVGRSEQAGLSRMTFVVRGDDETVEQVDKQLQKLIEVRTVTNVTQEPHVRRELALVRLNATDKTRSEIVQLTQIFNGKVLNVSLNQMVVEIVGAAEKIDDFLALMHPFGVREISRTGTVVMKRQSASADAPVRIREDVA